MVQYNNHGVLKFSERNEIVGKEPIKPIMQESYPQSNHEVKAELLSIPKLENKQPNVEVKEVIKIPELEIQNPPKLEELEKPAENKEDIELASFKPTAPTAPTVKPADVKPAAINPLKLKIYIYMFKLFRDDRRV